jgi:hypothetical protein
MTVVGALLGAQPGESLRMRGWWSSHAQYGRQFARVGIFNAGDVVLYNEHMFRARWCTRKPEAR